MKSLFKATLLATTYGCALNAAAVISLLILLQALLHTEDSKAFKMTTRNPPTIWRILDRYMENSLKEQEKLGIKLDKAPADRGRSGRIYG